MSLTTDNNDNSSNNYNTANTIEQLNLNSVWGDRYKG